MMIMIGYQGFELFVTDSADSFTVDLRDHGTNLLFSWVETEGPHRHLELFGVDGAGIGREQVERLANLLPLILRELRSG